MTAEGARARCRLLVFEGIMGSGKSSATRRFGNLLAASGRTVDVVTEAADPHPVRASDDLVDFFEPWLHASPEELAARARAKWARLVAERARDERTTVMDGQVFHGDLTHLFLMEMPRPALEAHVDALLRELAPLAPVLVYLVQEDLAAALRRVAAERGERWVDYQAGWKLNSPYARRRGLSGLDGLVSLYRDYRQLTDALYARLACSRLQIDTSGRDWDRYDRQIASALGEAGPGG